MLRSRSFVLAPGLILAACGPAPEGRAISVDSQYGPKTSAAIRPYQLDHGLPGDGKLPQ